MEVVESIEYRNLAPLYCYEEMRICGSMKRALEKGAVYDVWIEGPSGGVAVRGTVHTILRETAPSPPSTSTQETASSPPSNIESAPQPQIVSAPQPDDAPKARLQMARPLSQLRGLADTSVPGQLAVPAFRPSFVRLEDNRLRGRMQKAWKDHEKAISRAATKQQKLLAREQKAQELLAQEQKAPQSTKVILEQVNKLLPQEQKAPTTKAGKKRLKKLLALRELLAQEQESPQSAEAKTSPGAHKATELEAALEFAPTTEAAKKLLRLKSLAAQDEKAAREQKISQYIKALALSDAHNPPEPENASNPGPTSFEPTLEAKQSNEPSSPLSANSGPSSQPQGEITETPTPHQTASQPQSREVASSSMHARSPAHGRIPRTRLRAHTFVISHPRPPTVRVVKSLTPVKPTISVLTKRIVRRLTHRHSSQETAIKPIPLLRKHAAKERRDPDITVARHSRYLEQGVRMIEKPPIRYTGSSEDPERRILR